MNPVYSPESCVSVIKVAMLGRIELCIEEFKGDFEALQTEVGYQLNQREEWLRKSKDVLMIGFLEDEIKRLQIAFNYVMGF